MAGAFGVGNEVDEQHTGIGAIRRLLAELVTPQPERPPGAQFVRDQADDVRVFSRLRDKFEVVQPDFIERAAHSESRAAHFLNSGCSVLSMRRPLSRNASLKIFAGFSSGHCGSPNRPAGAGKTL